MTPNTDPPNNYVPNAADDDSSSPGSIILDFSLKRKIDPKSMLKLKKFTVTDVDAATGNASSNTINISSHSPSAATAPDTEATTA